jgi:hypothetical protein
MSFETREGQGALFRNEDKAEGDNRPNATGKAKIGGIDFWVSAWTKTTKNGDRFQSLSFKPMNDASSSSRLAEPSVGRLDKGQRSDVLAAEIKKAVDAVYDDPIPF